MSESIQLPNENSINIALTNILGQTDFEDIMQRIAFTALENMRESMTGHNRSSLTVESLMMWPLEQSNNQVSIAVGSQSRGQILKWLDKGRGEVRPVNRRFLRWFTWPEHVAVFSRYSRATTGIGLMIKAGDVGITQAANITTETLNRAAAVST